MRINHVKEKLKRGEPTGRWLIFPSISSARIMARISFGLLMVDMEHSTQNPALMAEYGHHCRRRNKCSHCAHPDQ